MDDDCECAEHCCGGMCCPDECLCGEYCDEPRGSARKR